MANPLETSFEPLPYDEPELPTSFEPLPSLDDEEDAKDNVVRAAFTLAPNTDADAQRRAGVLRFARETKIPTDVVEAKYDELRTTFERAGQDPRKWRTENPLLAKLALERPELGELVVKDKELSDFTKFIAKAWNWIDAWDRDALTVPYVEGESSEDTKARLRLQLEANRVQLEQKQAEVDKPKPTVVRQDQVSQSINAGGALGQVYSVGFRYAEAQRQMELSKLNFELLMSRGRGGADTYELEKRILDLQRDLVPRDFEEDGITRMFGEAAAAVASQVEVLKGGGVGAGVGTVVGGTAGAVLGKGKGAQVGARLGAKLGGKAGAALASLQLEAGSMYGTLLDARTDRGEALSEEEAAGGALLYGGLASVVELASMPQLFRTLGPLGGKAGLKTLLGSDAGVRAIARNVATQWFKAGATEGAEEVVQQGLEQLVAYLTKSKAAGELQDGPVFNPVELVEAGRQGFMGGLGLASVTSTLSFQAQLLKLDAGRKSAQQVEALAGLANSPTAKASPDAASQVVADATARTGEAVTAVYVEPTAFQRLFQDGIEAGEAAAQLLGEGGAQKLQEALATGQRLEVPVALYIERWNQGEVAKALRADTATQPGGLTPRQLEAAEADVERQAKELADTVQAEAQPTAAELKLDAAEAQLESAGLSRSEAKASMAPLRALVRTAKARTGDDVLADVELQVEKGEGLAPDAALKQAAKPPSASEALSKLYREELAPEQMRRFFIDSTTGVLNARAWKRIDPKGRRVAVISIEGVKWQNDARGHEAGNNVYRAAARALAPLAPELAKVGGDFALYVKSQAELDTLLLEANRNVALEGFTLSGMTGKDLRTAAALNNESKQRAEKRGKRSPRGSRPMWATAQEANQVGFTNELVQGTPISTELAAAFEATEFKDRWAEIFTEPGTGLLTKDGFDALPPKKFRASIDVNGLKDINQLLGEHAGDQLVFAFGMMLRHHGGSNFDAAHISGDEYALQSDSREELQAFVADLEQLAAGAILEVGNVGGEAVSIHGLPFGVGIGENLDAADHALNDHKAELTRRGLRGPEATARRIVVGGARDGEGQRQAVQVQVADDGRGDGDRGGRGEAPGRQGEAQRYVAPERLEQAADGGAAPRGYLEMAQRGTQRIFKVVLNPKADLSTFLHESGHLFLELFGDLAERTTNEQVRADWATALKFLGVTNRGEIRREHHEKWARMAERYFADGKAPTPELAGSFERFKLWLRTIYRAIASLGAPLNAEISGVMDRLLATDDELQRARSKQKLESLWRSPAEAGMTPEQWQAHLSQLEEATSHARRAGELRALKERHRAQEAWWRDQEKAERAKAANDYEALPARQAQQLLKGVPTGQWAGVQIKLDRESTEAILGPKAEEKLGVRLSADGVHPDEVARLLGYTTGQGMLDAVATLPDKKVWVQETAQFRMEAQYPDVLVDRTQLREAVEKGANGDLTARWLLAELEALRKKGVGTQAPVESIKRAAELITGRRTIARLDAGGALRAQGSASEKALKAAAKGDFAQAYVFRQQQLLNLYLYRELSEAREERDAFQQLAGDLGTDKARARLGLGGAAYRDGVDLVLEHLGLKEVSPREEPLRSFGEVVTEMVADGATVLFDEGVLQRVLAKPTPWRELSVDQMREVTKALKNLQGAARTKATVVLEGKRVDRREAIAQLVAEAEKNLKPGATRASSESARTLMQRVRDQLGGLDAQQLPPERLFEMLGGLDTYLDSTWGAVMRRLQEAKAREFDLLASLKPLLEAFEKVPPKVAARVHEAIDGKALFPNHRVANDQNLAPPSRRYELLMIALNAGNESNLKRLTEGRNITEAEVMAAISLLTKEELDWVQAVWDSAESLWPESRALEERASGLAPPKIPPRPLVTPHGTYKGGYLPAAYDHRIEPVGEAQIAALLTPAVGRPGTPHGHLKRRVQGFTGAIALEPSIILRHLTQVVHDIAFREAVQDSANLLLSPEVQAVLKDRQGESYATGVKEWLRSVGQGRGASDNTQFGQLMQKLKSRTTVAVLGYSLKTAAGDLSTPLSAVIGSGLKVRHLVAAFGELGTSPLELRDFAASKSGEIRGRRAHVSKELRSRIASFTDTGLFSKPALRWFVDHAFDVFEFIDSFSSSLVWKAGYRQKLLEGESEAKAIDFGNWLVRNCLPSGSIVDKASLLTNPGTMAPMLMMFGFFSHQYGRLRRISHPVANAQGALAKLRASPRAIASFVALMTINGALAELLSGRGPEGDEPWAEWYLRKLTLGALGAVPFGGDLARAAESELAGKRATSSDRSIAGVLLSLWKAAEKVRDDDVDGERKIIALLQATGPLIGLPLGQAMRTAGYLADVVQGDVDVRGPGDLIGGVIYGQRDGQPANIPSAAQNLVSGQ